MQSLRFCAGDPHLRLVALLHVVGEALPNDADPRSEKEQNEGSDAANAVERALTRLRLSNAEIERGRGLVAGIRSIPEDLPADERAVRRLLNAHGRLLPDLLALVAAHRRGLAHCAAGAKLEQLDRIAGLAKQIQSEHQPLALADLAVTGADLMHELGLPQSKTVGGLLHFLLERVLDDPSLNRRDALLELAARARAGVEDGDGDGERR